MAILEIQNRPFYLTKNRPEGRFFDRYLFAHWGGTLSHHYWGGKLNIQYEHIVVKMEFYSIIARPEPTSRVSKFLQQKKAS